MIFIARDYKGRSVSIISCNTEEIAKAYWQGQGYILIQLISLIQVFLGQ